MKHWATSATAELLVYVWQPTDVDAAWRCTCRHQYILSVSKTRPSTRSVETRCRQFHTLQHGCQTRPVTVCHQLSFEVFNMSVFLFCVCCFFHFRLFFFVKCFTNFRLSRLTFSFNCCPLLLLTTNYCDIYKSITACMFVAAIQ